MDYESIVGTIGVVGFTYPPRGWALCDGSLLSIAQNTALFSLLGTTYGGDGRSTFGLPDLRGRVPVAQGQGPGLAAVAMGQTWGVPSTTLTTAQLPMHTHPQTAYVDATSPDPSNAVVATAPSRAFRASGGTFTFATLSAAGGSQPHPNLQPYVALIYCIALQGIYPSRP